MSDEAKSPCGLRIVARPSLDRPRLVFGLSGWMNGGDVSTGTIEYLARKCGADVLGEIDDEAFYLFSFPGSMELSALIRPFCKIEDGLITGYKMPRNALFCCEAQGLILMVGREPNLRWDQYADCVFSLCERFGVSAIWFIGSVAGLVPHSREPRLHASVSDEKLKPMLEQFRVRFSNYEGPASVVTYLTRRAAERGLPMVSLVAEIPAYVQGPNHRCIESAVRQLAGILNVQVPLDDLRAMGDRLERRLDEVLQKHPELLERIRKLEEDYDNDVFNTEMGDLKDWLEQKGIRLD